MRILTTLLLFCTLVSSSLFAQKKELKTKFGKLTDPETAMNSYAPDPEAPAVVLFDKGLVSHRYVDRHGFMQEFQRHVRIKVFKKEAYDLANVIIFFFKWQKITDLKASCYNLENGKWVETELDKDNVFEESLTKNRLLKKFSVPGVREGCIFEYKYTVADESSADLPDWTFQRETVPTIWSEFEAEVPSFLEFGKITQGWYPFTLAKDERENKNMSINFTQRSDGRVTTSSTQNVNVDYQVQSLHFIQENIPALKPEGFVASASDYLSKVFFDIRAVYDIDMEPAGTSYRLVNGAFREHNNTWEKLGGEMLDDVYDDVLHSSRYTGETADQTVADKHTNIEKATALYEYIGKNYQVDRLPFIWVTKSLEKIVKDHKGSETELNLLLINMLRQAKLNAWPVLISTRSHGRIHPIHVSPGELDRVITALELEDGTLLLIDASAFPNPVGLLDAEDINDEGLLLKSKTETKWVPLQNKFTDKNIYLATLALKPEGPLSGKVVCAQTGYSAVSSRGTLAKNQDKNNFVRTVFKDWATDGAFDQITVENAENWQEPTVKTTFEFETSAFSTVSGSKIFVSPALGLGLHKNPFNNPQRKFNVDLGVPHEEHYNIIINIPQGYQLEEKPKGAKIAFGENALVFEYLVEATPEQVKIIIRNKYKKPYIGVEQYAELREYFSTIVAKMEEQIVFVK